MQYSAKQVDSPLGRLLLVAQDEGLCGIWMEGQKYFAPGIREGDLDWEDTAPLRAAWHWLAAYFAGERPDVAELPLMPVGSNFRQTVWAELCRIPYGQVVTYGQIADRVAHTLGRETMSAQAVGGVVGHNPFSIVIPCHRVVGSDGSLTGYAGGIQKKLWLLEHEGVDLRTLHLPTHGTAL